MAEIKFNRIARGWQASEDGRYAVISEHVILNNDDFGAAQEWAAAYDPQGRLRADRHAGTNLDWFDTARDAKAAVQRHARTR